MTDNVKVVSINEQKIVKQTIILTIILSILFTGLLNTFVSCDSFLEWSFTYLSRYF